ncbi:MAG: hypothetical protein K0U12_01415 [Gammaproteobacteria bacterium]|nr:hypothetical protein [Gammaproteobacteria bacterium]
MKKIIQLIAGLSLIGFATVSLASQTSQPLTIKVVAGLKTGKAVFLSKQGGVNTNAIRGSINLPAGGSSGVLPVHNGGQATIMPSSKSNIIYTDPSLNTTAFTMMAGGGDSDFCIMHASSIVVKNQAGKLTATSSIPQCVTISSIDNHYSLAGDSVTITLGLGTQKNS